MNLNFTEEQQAIIELARQFARDEMAPHAAHWDEKKIFPKDVLKRAAELGLATMLVKEADGGAGLTRLDAALVFNELSNACPSTAAYLSIHNMVATVIAQHASEPLRQQWLPKLTSMETFASYCLTEPNAGSDAASLQTSAVLEDEHYILNGTKAFISGAGLTDLYLVMARTGVAGPKGISCFLVEKERAGISFGKQELKLGWHSQPTAMVFFENCKIPKNHLVGEEGRGFNIALAALNGGRINIAACSLGGATACLEHATRYVQERKQFGKALAEMQHIQFEIADCYTELEAAKLMVWRAANSLQENHADAAMHCAAAKRFATDIGFSITNRCLQLLGGYGYLQDYPIERYFRDLRVHQILEGTNEIMRVIIAKQLFK